MANCSRCDGCSIFNLQWEPLLHKDLIRNLVGETRYAEGNELFLVPAAAGPPRA